MQQFFQTYSASPNLSGDATNNFAQVRPTINNSNGYQVRVDHRFSDDDNIFFRYTEQRVSVSNPIGQDGSTGGSSAGRNYGGGWTHTFSPRLILDVRAGYAGRPGVDSGQSNQHEAGTEPMKQPDLATSTSTVACSSGSPTGPTVATTISVCGALHFGKTRTGASRRT